MTTVALNFIFYGYMDLTVIARLVKSCENKYAIVEHCYNNIE